MSYGLIDDRDCFELYVLFWCCPMAPSVPRTRGGFPLYGVAIGHNSLIVDGESDGNLHPSKGVVAYGSKEDFILNAMVGFYLNDLC